MDRSVLVEKFFFSATVGLALALVNAGPAWGLRAESPIATPNPPENADDTALTADQEIDTSLDEILQGHSAHGDAFNEGPRQRAYLMGGTGNVQFPVTTNSSEAQAFINQGVGQLHGFWFLEAERSFRQAAALDEDCAMAYWGAAMAAYKKRDRSQGFIKKAVELKEKVTDREKMYIDALDKYFTDQADDDKAEGKDDDKAKDTVEDESKEDYEAKDTNEKDKKEKDGDEKTERRQQFLKDLESIVIKYPDDIEAKAFVAHRIWDNSEKGIPIASYLAADALINQILEKEPLHPAHHYTIHLWDHRDPKSAIRSAARCGIAAPSIAHMWHMPGHIYSRLKRYEDAVFQQEASARVDHAQMMRDRLMPDEINNYAHNNEWLIRNLSFVGRANDAVSLARNMIELPRHPKYNTLKKKSGSSSYGRRRLLQVLREYQFFDTAVDLCQSAYLDCPNLPDEQIKTLRLLACSAAMTGRNQIVEQVKSDISKQLADSKNEQTKTNQEVTKLTAAQDGSAACSPNDDCKGDSKQNKSPLKKAEEKQAELKKRIKELEKSELAIEGYQRVALGDYKNAYEKLTKAAGEDLSWIGELQFLAGEADRGLETVADQVKRRPKEVLPLARLAFLRHKNGDREMARESFEKLRDVSSLMDLDVPVFARLEPLALELGLGQQWRKQPQLASDVGFRPPLNSLGPFRWSPSMAPKWNLEDSNGETIGSAELAGQPHVLIFYLGHGCLHCAEQLQAFAPRVPDFEDAGIQMVAISTDDQQGLQTSIDGFSGEMPIRLASDEQNKIFKSFRAFDDFEGKPLHGTFLVDSSGRIRWQDISYEPFMEHEFLLDEAKRLLADKLNPDAPVDGGITVN